MARKKIVKRNIKNKKVNTLVAMQKMEKDLSKTSAKLGAELKKEISVLKQEETKVKKSIHQLTKAKAKTSQQRALHVQLQKIIRSIEVATIKHEKLSALRNLITQFEKNWAKNNKKSTKQQKLKLVVVKTTPATQAKEKGKIEPIETTTEENIKLPEVAEIIS